MGFWQRLGTAWKAATGTNPAAKNAGRLAQPGRYGSGMYPSWRAMLSGMAFGGKVQPIKPEDARDGIDNSIVAICIAWIVTSWLVAVPQVGTLTASGEFQPLKVRHTFLDTLDSPLSPQDEYSNLMWSLIPDFIRRGNAYAHIVRNKNREIISLEYIAARFVRPVPDETGRLSHYIYVGGGIEERIEPEDIVHFKHGSMENFPLLGISPLAAQYREIVTDNAYSDYSAGLAQSGGVPPIVFSPKLLKTADGETTVDLSEDDAEMLTKQFTEKLEQEPGKPRFVSGAVDMHKMGIDPDKMALIDVRAMPETRIPAALGLPALLLQLYTGVQRSTFSNLKEAIKQGWRGCLIPLMSYFARRITHQALRQFPGAKNLVFRWDYSNVPELAEDRTEEWKNSREDFQAGILTLEEVRADRGRATTPAVAQELRQGRGNNEDPVPSPVAGGKRFAPSLSITKRETVSDSSSDMASAIADFRKRLRDREAIAVGEMSDALNIVETRILADLDKVLADMEAAAEAGQTINESWLHQEDRYRSLLAQINEQYASLSSVAPALVDAQRDMVNDSASAAEALARVAAGTVPEGVDASTAISWNALPVSTLENLVGAASDGTPFADLLGEFATETGNKVGEGILNALIAGTGAGHNPRKIAAMMRESAEAQLALTRNRAETIARTETRRAGNEASRQSYLANQHIVNGWYWKAAADSRTCSCCWAMDGTLHECSETLNGHPGDRCCMVPQTKSWGELLGPEFADLPDTRPVIEEGETIFAGLHDSDQKEILGKELHGLYRNGDIKLSDCVVTVENARWGSMRRAATVDEAKANAAMRKQREG